MPVCLLDLILNSYLVSPFRLHIGYIPDVKDTKHFFTRNMGLDDRKIIQKVVNYTFLSIKCTLLKPSLTAK